MQVSVESGDGLVKRLSVSLPAEQVNELMDKKLKQAAREVRLDGFRPGKVPVRVVKQRYGHQIRQEVYGELIESTFYLATQQENLRPVGQPDIELNEDKETGGLTYVASFEVMPEVELADLSQIQVKRPQVEVTEQDIDDMIEKLRKQRVEWVDVEREAANGDRLVIDFTGYMGDEPFEGGSATDVPLELGSGTMIPGFEDGLLGAKAGEKRTLELTFPEDYHVENLAGKDVRFEVEVKSIAEPKLPEVDERFIESLGVEAGTIEALRQEIRENMEREVRQKIKRQVKEQVMNALLELHDIEVPKAAVEGEAQALKKQAQQEMAQAGQQSSLDLPLSLFEDQAKRRIKLGLIVGEVIRLNDIKVDDTRVDAAIEEQAATFESPEEVIQYYRDNTEARSAVENVILEDQVVEWIMDQCQVDDEDMDFATLMDAKSA